MWQKFGIRTQLVLLMLGLLVFTQVSTLVLINWFDAKERQIIALEQAQTLARSLNNDFLKTILNPTVDNFTELSFRVSGYQPVDAVSIRDQQQQPIYEYGKDEYIQVSRSITATLGQPLYKDEHLFLNVPVEAEGHVFGYALIVMDPRQYATQIEDRFATLLWIFPLELLLGLYVASRMSLRFTQPFAKLAEAMRQQEVLSNRFDPIVTQAQNEVGQLFKGYNQMMTNIQQSTQALRYQSHHDSLTGLYNRYAIEQALIAALQDEDADEHQLLMIDLDQFKLVNDAQGHAAGDALLKVMSQSLQTQLPQSALLARLGGDDFMVLLPRTSFSVGHQIVQALLSLLRDYRFVWQGQAISVSGSMGLVSFKPNEYTLEALIKAVDTAFYVAKSSGRNHCHYYHADDAHTQQFDRDIQVAGYIKEALGSGPARFELFAQAIVPLQADTDEIGYEILIRLWDSEGRFVAPNDFLPTAERYQLMPEIDRFVLMTYLSTVTQYPEHVAKLHVAHVNLSGGSLNHPDFQVALKQAISTFSFPWRKLALEITETSAVGNLTKAVDFIQYCKNIGIGFALDDFGTGMSSFEYLKHLPFDVIKIDGSFIKDMHKDPLDLAVIRYIQEISVLRQQETVAEYVETAQDVEALRHIGITYGQGYFLGKPKPLSDWLGVNKA
jgi:diguanylate cyclase (GGDEF)-like protein